MQRKKTFHKIEIKEPEIREYFTYLYSTKRILWTNFILGLARGFGFVMGATVVVALIVYIVSQILVQIPIVGNFFEWLNQFLQSSLSKSGHFSSQEFGR